MTNAEGTRSMHSLAPTASLRLDEKSREDREDIREVRNVLDLQPLMLEDTLRGTTARAMPALKNRTRARVSTAPRTRL